MLCRYRRTIVDTPTIAASRCPRGRRPLAAQLIECDSTPETGRAPRDHVADDGLRLAVVPLRDRQITRHQARR
jgi:hypothetical protein